MSSGINELELQSLVDGELNVRERNAVLESISLGDAAAWRTIALAFVEEQSLRRGLCEPAAVDIPDAAGQDSAKAPRQQNPTSAPLNERSKSSSVARLQSPRRRIALGVALAASVCAAAFALFAWGHSQGQRSGIRRGFAQAANDQSLTDGTASATENGNNRGDPSGQVADSIMPAAFPASPPIVDPWLTEPWAAQLRTQWLQAGYVVNPRPVPMTVKLPGGGTADIILSDPQIQYVGSSAFQ